MAYDRAYIWPAIWFTPGLYYDFTLVTYTTAYTLGPELDEMHIDATPPACSTGPSTAPHGRAHRLPLLLAAGLQCQGKYQGFLNAMKTKSKILWVGTFCGNFGPAQ